MQMRPADFALLTPPEFRAACKAWGEAREAACRDAWERTRFAAAAALAPHLKGSRSPQSLFPLPWDKRSPTPSLPHGGGSAGGGTGSGGTPAAVCSKEESLRRFKLLTKSPSHRGGGTPAAANRNSSTPAAGNLQKEAAGGKSAAPPPRERNTGGKA